ncbi:homocysteine S-methyltransferase family protein [Vagococcus carniphilus]|uniref:homocysteine S-methyltransferase family protein n=1 Tax=Vagococcus carniphilus TaxID=218144 RepID=UPI00289234E8|nr:homocysteine S-methyltransferase family protein [Vagococcus carniphilus]MDT2849475.1 homocysteine S-methyltransferase family protein [Vagococcus carniphilus]
MKELLASLNNDFLLVDGAMGTMFYQKGLPMDEQPELFNLTHPEIVAAIHQEYVDAGADIVTTNTFQANGRHFKYEKLSQIIRQAILLAKSVNPRFVAFDMGPIGEMMEPVGKLTFNEAYRLFKEQAVLAEKFGCDLIIIETMSDLLEIKAAILAVKENTSLPIFATMTFQQNGRTFIGVDALTAVLTLQGLGVEAVGVNCSCTPKELLPTVKIMTDYAKIPVIVQANAGLPKIERDKSVYTIKVADYVESVIEMVEMGVRVVGGCCGTTPEFIKAIRQSLAEAQPIIKRSKRVSAVSSSQKTIILNNRLTLISRGISPVGKISLENAIRNETYSYILKEALREVDAGGEILDINVSLVDIDESEVMAKIVSFLQKSIVEPLQLDSIEASVLEAGARQYAGRPLFNSVNGTKESMKDIFPIVKKYGGVVIGMTFDEDGIPETAEGRVLIAKKIIQQALEYGIDKEDILIDPLVLPVSTQPSQVQVVIDTLKLLKTELNVLTVAGISNISYGLPNRSLLDRTFLTSCVTAGLDAPIINPLSESLMETVGTIKLFSNQDKNAQQYVKRHQGSKISNNRLKEERILLKQLIVQGREEESVIEVNNLLRKGVPPLLIIKDELIPAMDDAGALFEKEQLFLPQLMQATEAFKKVQDVIQTYMVEHGEIRESKGKIILASVKGDHHDLGKSIVKILIENSGYQVIDLGEDVSTEKIVETIQNEEIKLVGLSALMTSSVKNMKQTISAVKETGLECQFIVGGAVMNEENRKFVGADYYAKDAMDWLKIVEMIDF